MTRWFRFYTSVVDDPKAQMLAPDLFKHWVNVLCIAAENDGELPTLSAVAFKLRLAEPKAAAVLAKLCGFGLLDRTESGFKPHNWDGRQYKSDRDETAAERAKRYRDGKRERNASVTRDAGRDVTQSSRPPEAETETDNSETIVSGAAAPPDPSIAERELFDRGKQVLGKSAGGQIAKLKAAKGGNVALARAVIEAASTKENPAEYVAAAIRAGPRSGFAKPLTEFQRKQQETNDVRQMLRDSATAARGGGTADRVLSIDHGGGPEGLRGGTGSGFLDLQAAPSSQGR